MAAAAKTPSHPVAGSVLIVDDEASIRELAGIALAPIASRIFQASSAEQALEILNHENIDVVLSDLRMPGMDGISFLRRVREEQPGVRFVLFTGHGRMDTVVQAMRFGASDFLSKPFDNGELRDILSRQLRLAEVPGRMPPRLPFAPSVDAAAGHGPAGLLGQSPAFRKSIDTARRASLAGSNVLLTGESGTGKEGFARFIHDASDRHARPFIPINCGAISENLIESELFGHVRGAFTGALSDRPGKFVLADGGTLFLDEIGEMPLSMQVRLLRVLQERMVEPVGAGHSVPTDFRLIAATHRDLREDVRAGRFREDLWFRLHVIPVALPPLRERGADVLLLGRHFLGHFNARHGASFAFSPAQERALMEHPWPGNVRELMNVVERAVVLSEGSELELSLSRSRAGEGTGLTDTREGGSHAGGFFVRERRRAAEREAILAALEACRWNKTSAAEQLGISRRGLLYKVKEYGIG